MQQGKGYEKSKERTRREHRRGTCLILGRAGKASQTTWNLDRGFSVSAPADIWGQITLCCVGLGCGGEGQCRMLSNIPAGLCSLDVSSAPANYDNPKCLPVLWVVDRAQHPVENHCSRLRLEKSELLGKSA